MFYSPGINSHIEINQYINNQLNEQLDYKLIDLSNFLTPEMYRDKIHFNEKGHKAVSDVIKKHLKKLIKND